MKKIEVCAVAVLVILGGIYFWHGNLFSDNGRLGLSGENLKDGWSVLLLGSQPVVKDDITFSDVITELGSVDSDTGSAKGKLMKVDLTMNSSALNGKAIQALFVALIDQNNRRYEYEGGDSECSSDTSTAGVQYLKPNIPCVMHARFEVSNDSNSFNLKLYYKNGAK